MTADERLDLELLKQREAKDSSSRRQLTATMVPELENDPEPEVRTQETQTLTQAELIGNMGVGFLEYVTLFGDMELDAYGHYHRQFAMRLFCPLIQDKDLPACVSPDALRAAGYDSAVGAMQITPGLIMTQKHEMIEFFQRFELALHSGRLDGSTPTVWDAWEALGRVLWGLALHLYNFMRMDYDNGRC